MSQMKCRGWWEQAGFGRQSMESLELEFDGQKLSGMGIDVVGAFRLDGYLDNGKTVLNKQYVGRHRVVYLGTYDGEGTFHGQWRLAADHGKWMIQIDRSSQKSASQTAEEIPLFEPSVG